MMHRPLLLLTTMILGVATIAVTMVSASLQSPASLDASHSGDVTIILRYYDAVNEMIATGDPTALRDVVHPEMIDLDPPPAELAGREGIEGYLGNLHSVGPDIRIEPGTVAANGERVVAQLVVGEGSSSLPLGFTGNETAIFWPPVETFRVSGGKIVERQFRWDGLVSLSPTSAPPFPMDIPARRNLEVFSNTYTPGAIGRFTTGAQPAILRIVGGNVTFSLAASASDSALVLSPSFNTEAESHERVLPGNTRNLDLGEVVLVPQASAYSVLNARELPAAVLSVAIMAPSLIGLDDNVIPQTHQHGITVRLLLTLPTDELDASAQVSLGNATLMPGSHLTVDPDTSLMVLWTEHGELTTTARRSSCREAGFASSTLPDDEQYLDNLHLICVSESRGSAAVFNAGDESAAAWIIAVTA
jgi:hypothetical protein